MDFELVPFIHLPSFGIGPAVLTDDQLLYVPPFNILACIYAIVTNDPTTVIANLKSPMLFTTSFTYRQHNGVFPGTVFKVNLVNSRCDYLRLDGNTVQRSPRR
jgi:hypothetical protein